jgi:hypothetical protein
VLITDADRTSYCRDVTSVQAATTTCVACGSSEMKFLGDLGQVPVHSGVTYATREEAISSPSAPMTLVYCPACSMAYNNAFDASLIDYDVNYDNSLHYSSTFQAYAAALAARLARAYRLDGRRIVELGSGKGHFLVDLCTAANATGTGFDPSYDEEVTHPQVRFVRELMPWDTPPEFDFFVTRHVLEHLADPFDFLTQLRRVCGKQAISGYIEVPDAIYDFERSPWNCLYPHASYFSATALARLAIRAGFGVIQLVRSFEGQYLGLELGVNVATPDEVPFHGMGLHREREILADFQASYANIVSAWRERLQRLGYKRCALWGAGAKGLGFLDAVDPDGQLGAVVDLNIAKHGRYLPVTGHEILNPAELSGRDVAAVVITNPAYESEIAQSLTAIGVHADVLAAH